MLGGLCKRCVEPTTYSMRGDGLQSERELKSFCFHPKIHTKLMKDKKSTNGGITCTVQIFLSMKQTSVW